MVSSSNGVGNSYTFRAFCRRIIFEEEAVSNFGDSFSIDMVGVFGGNSI